MTLKHVKKYWLCACLLMAALPGVAITQSVSVVDDDGHKVSLQQPAQRIISLAPSMTVIPIDV